MSAITTGVFHSNAALSSGSNWTVTKPAGTVDGDLMLVSFFLNTASGTTVTSTPSGWTQGFFNSTSLLTGLIGYWWKRAAAEPASWSWQFSAFADGAFGFVSTSGIDATTPVLATSTLNDAGTTTATCNSPSWAGAANAVSICLLGFQPNPGAITPPAGYNDSTDGWTDNDGTEYGFHYGNLTTQLGVTSLPSRSFTSVTAVGHDTLQVALQVAVTGGASILSNPSPGQAWRHHYWKMQGRPFLVATPTAGVAPQVTYGYGSN
jgi:hypothetical protein